MTNRWMKVAMMAALTMTGAACTVSTTGTSSGPSGSSTTSSAPSSTSPAGRCTGHALEARAMNDVSSCHAQGGEWHRPTTQPGECWSSMNSDLCGSKTGYEPGYDGDWGKSDCTKLLGCQWENPDGSIEVNPDLGGKCVGQVLPCDDLPKDHCWESSGCKWYGSSCGNADIYKNTQPKCSDFSVGTNIKAMLGHPDTTRSGCLRQLGCSFERVDGTVEQAK